MFSRVCVRRRFSRSQVPAYLSLGQHVVTQDPAALKTSEGAIVCHVLAPTRDKLGSNSIPRQRVSPAVKVRYLLDMLHPLATSFDDISFIMAILFIVFSFK